jgi:CHAD domain-containing protein
VPTEIEDKYDVDELFTVPDLTGVGPIASVGEPHEESLEALYFDTADLRLATGNATLRRRLGGHDEGWHLKLAIAPGVRTEIHRPAGSSTRTPPIALRRLVRALTRTARLEPVARLRTARTIRELLDADGEVLAEVCDDRVTAEELGSTAVVSSWRELEVELVGGGDDLLAAVIPRLTKAGARPAAYPSKLARVLGARLRARQPAPIDKNTAGEKIWAAVKEQIDALKAYDPRVQRNEPDSVHKMRVATRRLRSLLAAYRPLFDREVTEPIREELKWLGGVLGVARDAEVLGDRLINELHELPDDLVLGPVASRITSEHTSRYRDAHAAVLTELAGDRYLALLDRLDALVHTPPLTDVAAKPARNVMPARVQHAWRRVDRAVEHARQPDVERDAALHAVRKAAKRARYAATAAGADKFAKRLKRLQAVLGDHQDSVQARKELRATAVRAHLAGENGFSYGVLLGVEERRAARARRKFDTAWQSISKKY